MKIRDGWLSKPWGQTIYHCMAALGPSFRQPTFHPLSWNRWKGRKEPTRAGGQVNISKGYGYFNNPAQFVEHGTDLLRQIQNDWCAANNKQMMSLNEYISPLPWKSPSLTQLWTRDTQRATTQLDEQVPFTTTPSSKIAGFNIARYASLQKSKPNLCPILFDL